MSRKTTKNPKAGSTQGGRPPVSPVSSPANRPPVEGVTAPKPLPQISPSDAAKLRRGKL